MVANNDKESCGKDWSVVHHLGTIAEINSTFGLHWRSGSGPQ